MCNSRAIEFYEPTGPHGWLANYSEHIIVVGGAKWKTVEHYFQAAKFDEKALVRQIASARTPGRAKEIAKANKHKRRADWAKIRNLVMYNGVRAKFTQHEDLRKALLQTGNQVIIEWAPDDSYWGSGPQGQGRNQMGRLLMKLRDNLRA